jgi:hypothetical protein
MYAEINTEFYVFLTCNSYFRCTGRQKTKKFKVTLHMKLDKNSMIRLHESEI